ncbi:hypothetical protein Dimus_024752, partial [Dionaea muscipula]
LSGHGDGSPRLEATARCLAKRKGAARCSFLQGGETAQVDAGLRAAAVRSHGDRHAPLLAIRCLSKVTAARWPPPDTAVRCSPLEGAARGSCSLAAISASWLLADEGARTVSSSHHCSSRLPGAHYSQVADARPEPLLAEGSRWPRGALARLGWVAAIVLHVDHQLAAQVELFAQGFEQPAVAAGDAPSICS